MTSRLTVGLLFLLSSNLALAGCNKDGDIVTVTGIISEVPLEMANGSRTTVPVLTTTQPICIIQEGFGESPSLPANISRIQLIGKNPVYNVKLEIKGRISTGNVSQYYSTPNAMTVISGHKLSETQVGTASEQGLKFSGEFLQYPKGASEEQMRNLLPELRCFDFQGVRMCTSPVRLAGKQTILGMGGTCTINQDVKIGLENNSVTSVGCDTAKPVAEGLYNSLKGKYGPPHLERKQIEGAAVTYYEFKTGNDYVLISQWAGRDLYGKPLDKTDISVADHESLGRK